MADEQTYKPTDDEHYTHQSWSWDSRGQIEDLQDELRTTKKVLARLIEYLHRTNRIGPEIIPHITGKQ